MSIRALTKKLEIAKVKGNLPKIVVPVHLAGNSCDMQAINNLSKKYGFFVLEDASHAIGGHYKAMPVGNCMFSDIAVFSFHPVKIITTGEGGAVSTNDSHLAEKIKTIRTHGIVKDSKLFKQKADGPWIYEQHTIGFNYRMSDIQAALGRSQLNRLKTIINIRNNQLNIYRKLLQNTPVKLLEIDKDVLSSVHLAIVRLKDRSPDKHLKVFNSMRSVGIGVQVHYSPIHLQPYYKQFGFKKGDFPEAESYARNAISLPLFPGLSDEEIYFCVDKLNSFV